MRYRTTLRCREAGPWVKSLPGISPRSFPRRRPRVRQHRQGWGLGLGLGLALGLGLGFELVLVLGSGLHLLLPLLPQEIELDRLSKINPQDRQWTGNSYLTLTLTF